MIDKPGSLTRMLELVRLSAGARTERAAKLPDNAGSPVRAEAAARNIATLKARLRRLLDDVDPDDAAAAARSRKIVLREIFLWEFGDAIHNHGEFGAMLDAVEAAMAANDGTREKFAVVIRELRDGSGD